MMTPEDRLSRLLHQQADRYQTAPDGMEKIQRRIEARRRSRRRRKGALLAGAVAALAAVGVIVPVVAASHGQGPGGVRIIAPASPGRSPTTTTPPTTPPSTTTPPTTAPVAPETVVVEYYDAINSRDYRKAWALGGDNLSSNYAAYVQGYSGTASVTVTVLSTQGNTVDVKIAATQDNGGVATYQGTYTVSNGIIVSADIQGGLCDLTLTEGPGQGATGHYGQTLIYTNIGQVTCQVFGYAGLQFFNSNGQVPASVNHGGSFTFPAVAPASFSLAPGAQAAFDIGGLDYDNAAQSPCPSASIVVTIPPVTPAAREHIQIALPTPVPVCPSGTDESPVVAGSEGPHF